MAPQNVSVTLAFIAGFFSFLSPCVMPLVPAYLSYLSGLSVAELSSGEQGASSHAKILLNSLFFVLGTSLVFILLGATATFLGQFLFQNKLLINRIAGVLIVFFGLYLAGAFKKISWFNFLYYQKRFQVASGKTGLLFSFLLGLAFAFSWSPCIGPILGSILALASTEVTVGRGIILLTAYSAGLGLPFILISLGAGYFLKWLTRAKKWMRFIEVTSGGLLVIAGVLIFFDQLQAVSRYLNFLPAIFQ